MPAPLFSPAQNDRLEALYLNDGRPPSEIVAVLMAENPGLVVTSRQISERISTRNLGKKRREIIAEAELTVAKKISAAATSLVSKRATAANDHKEFLEASVRIGNKAIAKAEQILETSNSARDISSAVNAAAKGIAIVREAVGLDSSPNSPSFSGTTKIFFDFARSPGSPFYRPPEPTTGKQAEEGKPTDVGVVSPSEITPRPHAPS